jgi:hypothetical protein
MSVSEWVDPRATAWPDSFIHSVFCMMTGPTPLPKRFLHIVRSRASSFKWEYPLLWPDYVNENTNDTIGNWTHNLSACSLVPQPPVPVNTLILNMFWHITISIFREVFNAYFCRPGKKKYPRTCHYIFFYICDIFMLQTYNSFIYKFHIHLPHKAIFMLLRVSATIVAIIRETQYYQDISSVLYIITVNICTSERWEPCSSGLLHSK